MLQEGEEVAPGWARLHPDGHRLSSWPSAAKEGKPRPGVGPDDADHVVCAQKLHRRFLLHNQFINSFLPWMFLSLTQGRKVGVIYWMHELGWIMCPHKVQFSRQSQPTGLVLDGTCLWQRAAPGGPWGVIAPSAPCPYTSVTGGVASCLSPEFIHKFMWINPNPVSL